MNILSGNISTQDCSVLCTSDTRFVVYYCLIIFEIHSIIFQKFLEPMMFQKPVDEMKVARFQKEMEKCLNEIENVWLDCGRKDFITGDKISIADLLACCELEQPGNQVNFFIVLKFGKSLF